MSHKTLEELANEIVSEMLNVPTARNRIMGAIDEAIRSERERCVLIVERMFKDRGIGDPRLITEKIRSGIEVKE